MGDFYDMDRQTLTSYQAVNGLAGSQLFEMQSSVEATLSKDEEQKQLKQHFKGKMGGMRTGLNGSPNGSLAVYKDE